MKTSSLLITTRVPSSKGESVQTRLWEGHDTLAIGHPIRWVLERAPHGYRLRDISPEKNGIRSLSESSELISESDIERGREIRLPDSWGKGIRIQLRRARSLEHDFGARTESGQLYVYSCVGSWVRAFDALGERFEARADTQLFFTLVVKGEQARVRSHCEGLSLRHSDQAPEALRKDEERTFRLAELPELTLSRGGSLHWRFARLNAPALDPTVKEGTEESEAAWFRKSLQASGLLLASFLALSFLWPKPEKKSEDLIPEQFTRIVLQQQPKTEAPAASGTQGAPQIAQAPVKKAQDAAVVQAFRAKALQNAVSGLLKGGMTSLLAQSDFVAGTHSSQDAKRLLNSKSEALKAGGPMTGAIDMGQVKVSEVGGNGGSGGKGSVGYGKGEKAGVSGQGKSLVSLDTLASNVEEGLTKDEVGEVIHRHMNEVRYCYESAMIRTPDIEGKLMVAFTIGGNGVVKEASVKSSTLPDPRLDDCIIRRLVTWKFPLPKGGVNVGVSYPFIFKTLGR